MINMASSSSPSASFLSSSTAENPQPPHPNEGNSICTALRKREYEGSRHSTKMKRQFLATTDLVKRIGLQHELKGHKGCVNCLEWSADGRMLASGSDDLHVIFWDVWRQRPLHSIRTQHTSNIFSVKFLPFTGSRQIVTGAADGKVTIIETERKNTLHVYKHLSRVKRVDVACDTPYLVFSGSEDGMVMQCDLREPGEASGTVLLNLKAFGSHSRDTEVKCISVNPLRPELLAVGCSDPYTRLYDRRMIKQMENGRSQPSQIIDPPPGAKYFIPGHLQSTDSSRSTRSVTATYVTFSPDGSELLVNLGSEQVYLYDVNRPSKPVTYSPEVHSYEERHRLRPTTNGVHKSSLPVHIERLKMAANKEYKTNNYATAIRMYNGAISRHSSTPVLYANRAAAYIKRDWKGDVYAALRDCVTSIRIDPNQYKAHFRLCKCLLKLKRTAHAFNAAKMFQRRFPTHADGSDFKSILEEIERQNPDVLSELEWRDELEDELLHDQSHSFLEKSYKRAANDYSLRFCGHCNTTTDIKEANFIGSRGEFICAGSDDGSFFIWDRETTNITRVLHGDDSIVNCIQPHPDACILATSGIESTVKIWSPQATDFEHDREVMDQNLAARDNHRRMNTDPFELMLRSMGMQMVPNGGAEDDGGDGDGEQQCVHF